MKIRFLFLIAFLPCFMHAQSKWEKILGGPEVDEADVVIQTSDNMILVAGSSESFHAEDRWAYLAKIDLDGNLVWQNTYNNGSFWNVLSGIVEVGNGMGFLAVGSTWATNCGGGTMIMRFSNEGKWLWTKCLPDRGHPTAINKTNDGHYIICNTKSNGLSSYDFQITKIDQDANVFWTQVYTAPHWDFSYEVIQTKDNGFVVAGYVGIVGNGQTDAMIIKTDELGNELWRLFIGDTLSEYGSDVIELPNEDLLVLGSRPEANGYYRDVFLARIDPAGNLLWSKEIGAAGSFEFGTQLIRTHDGGYAILGYSALMNYSDERDIQLWKLDTSFAVIWQKTFGGNFEDEPRSIVETSDHGYCIAAGSTSFGDGNSDIYLIKTDSTGSSQRNIVKGVTYFDKNGSCTYDTLDDPLLAGISIQFAGKDTLLRFSNEEGKYLTLLDTGTYEMVPNAIGPYWDFCNFPQSFLFPNAIDTTCIDIPLTSNVLCPYLSIDITTPFMRRCFDNTIYINYCNYGTSLVQNPVIAITLDTFYVFQNASATLVSQAGNTYYFEVPQLDIWECGSFTVVANLSCEASLGEIHCVKAHIYPDTLCHPDADSLFVDEECRSNIGSYDPNDKIAFPSGTGDEHHIRSTTEIKYQIRFQNTGTDTAFNIVVIDTFSNELDLNSFRPGATSHPYTFDLINSTIGKWTFSNILLPDSATNLVGSMGFLDFFITPKAELREGTMILNQASIYFDFNTPIVTNTTFHTIHELSTAVNEPGEQEMPAFNFSIYPNPAQQFIRIMMDGMQPQSGYGNIYDMHGKKVQFIYVDQLSLEVSTEHLKDGMYAVTIVNSNGDICSKKFVVLR